MDITVLASAGDQNLVETWSRLGRAAGLDTEDDGSTVLTSSGLPIAFFNGVFVGRPVADRADADALVARAVDFFGRRAVPWLLWTREGVDPVLAAACARAGLREVGGPPGMVLPSIPSIPPAMPHGVDVLRATAQDVELLHVLLSQGYEMPIEVAERVIGPALFDADGVAVLIARLHGEPVSTALVSVSGATAGIYNVATLPAARGKGLGAAVTWAAVMAGRSMGADHAALQSSESGYPVYRRMGFVDVGRYEQWEGAVT